jgi:hypothetical protein
MWRWPRGSLQPFSALQSTILGPTAKLAINGVEMGRWVGKKKEDRISVMRGIEMYITYVHKNCHHKRKMTLANWGFAI